MYISSLSLHTLDHVVSCGSCKILLIEISSCALSTLGKVERAKGNPELITTQELDYCLDTNERYPRASMP